MEIYLCGSLVTTVTYPASGTGWRNFSTVIISASTGTGSCSLVFKSINSGSSGGVAPSNVQLVPIGNDTTNTYPPQKIPGACPTPAPTPRPTPKPTKKPTPAPTPKPTPAPTPGRSRR